MASFQGFSRHAPAVLLAALCGVLASLAQAADDPDRDRIGNEMVDRVKRAVAARDCSAAVYHLKDGLKSGRPKVALMAGSMYEHGLCVKQDWHTATGYYTLAYDGGLKQAAERLAAGYADPANGPDIAAALWWARQGRGFRAEGCMVGKDAADDPDRFVAALATWDPARLAACNYIAGVISTIGAELGYPEQGIDFSMGGDLLIRFYPGLANVQITQGESRHYGTSGVVDGDNYRFRNAKENTGAFRLAADAVAKRALARYPQPKGIPLESQLSMRYVFTIE